MWHFFSFRGCFLFVVVPTSLFIGAMIASAGTAVWPPLTAIATPLICAGEVEHESQRYSYKPGQQGISRTIWCVDGEAKEDITLSAVGASFLVYSALAFAALGLFAWLMRGRLRSATERFDPLRGLGARGSPDAPGSPADVDSLLAFVSDAVERGNARVVVRNLRIGDPGENPPEDDPADRLAQLKELLDQGLISAEDYEAKKAEILAGL